VKKVYYATEDERKKLLLEAASEGNYLIEDAITLEGNYLVFDAKPLQQSSSSDALIVAYEAIAALYEETEVLKARVAALEGGAA
jgi:hypothetical protein